VKVNRNGKYYTMLDTDGKIYRSIPQVRDWSLFNLKEHGEELKKFGKVNWLEKHGYKYVFPTSANEIAEWPPNKDVI